MGKGILGNLELEQFQSQVVDFAAKKKLLTGLDGPWQYSVVAAKTPQNIDQPQQMRCNYAEYKAD